MGNELRKKVEMEVHHHISPLIGWLRNDAVKGKVDTDGTRHDQWKERADLAVDAIMEHVGEVEYEYNIERISGITDRTSLCFGVDGWDDDLEAVKGDLKDYLEGDSAAKLGTKFRMVKRRKAGRIEDV